MHDEGEADRRHAAGGAARHGGRPGGDRRRGLSGRGRPFGPLRRQRRLLRRDRPRQGHAAGADPRQHARSSATPTTPTLDPGRDGRPRRGEDLRRPRPARATTRSRSIHDLLVEAFDRIDARLEHGEGVGVPTGFTDLDNLTGGLHESELVILAARPSMGKTALATNIAEYVTIEAGVPDAVRQPGNGPARVGPAACSARRGGSTPTSSAADVSRGRTATKLVEASAAAEQGAAVRRRHPRPHHAPKSPPPPGG